VEKTKFDLGPIDNCRRLNCSATARTAA